MNVSQPFHSFLNIAGVECDFPSKKELVEYLEKREKFTHIVTLNAEMVVEAQHNEQFKNIINKTEIVIPDGSSILWAKDYLTSHSSSKIISLLKFFFSNQQPITGVDTIFDICEIIDRKNGTVYLLGGKPTETQKTAEILEQKYPRLEVSIASPNTSFKRKGDEPSAIFVALGSPKQSLWIEQYRNALEDANITIAMGVGGAFAMIAGTLPRAPKWMRRHHLEWLWRIILEPSRIKRIWNAVVVFPKIVQKTT